MRATRVTTLLLSLAALALPACLGERDGTPPPDHQSPSAPSPSPAPAPAPSPLANLGPLGNVLANSLDNPGPYDPPRQSPGFDEAQPHWLALDLQGDIGELTPMSFFGGGELMELHALLQRLDKLAAGAQVQGLVVRFTDVSLDMATAEEVRGGLLAFRGDGKRKLACHADRPTNAVYYVMTACDSVGVQPVGDVNIPGPVATPLHLRGLLDRLGVVPDFVHVGAFKGAAEPLTRDAPSPELRETFAAIVDQAYRTMQSGIAEGRRLTPEEVAAHIDTAEFTPDAALAARLVDAVATYEEFRGQVTGGAAWKQVKLKESGAPGGLDVEKLQIFLGLVPPKRPKEKHVALVYALGNIVDGRGQGILGARQQVAGRTLSAAIDALAADDKVAAIVLRVSSPGGSAMASEQIWRATERAREKKPVIVSMGGVAASGGYYIACGANKIYALANTLTGSIGVVGGKLALGEMLGRVGVKTYAIGKGKRAAMWSPFTPWTADERALIQASMEDVYRTFVGRVAAGRGKTPEEVQPLAQGRVWTGAAAKERGLVDALGGLTDALAEARAVSGVGPEVALEVYPPEPTLKDLLQGLGGGGGLVRAAGAAGVFAELGALLDRASAGAVAGALDQVAAFQDAPVQTALVLPLVVR